jgi:hypothetical protein
MKAALFAVGCMPLLGCGWVGNKPSQAKDVLLNCETHFSSIIQMLPFVSAYS